MKLLEIIAESNQRPIDKLPLMEAVPESMRRPEGIVQVSDQKWLLVADDGKSVWSFASEADANTALDKITDPAVSRRDFNNEYNSQNRSSRLKSAIDNMDEADFNRKANSNRWLSRTVSSAPFRFLTGILRVAGPVLGAYYGILAAAADVQEDRSLSSEEKQELIEILYGMFIVEVGVILYNIFRTAKLAKAAIQTMRTGSRIILAAFTASGVGTVPGIIGMILSEAAWWGISWLLTNAKVQRSLADLLANTLGGQIFGVIGQGAQAAASALNTATNGLVGSPDLRRWLGLPDSDSESQIQSAAYGSSEWAKLVIGAIMYPQTADPIVIPYIEPQQREAFLAQALQINIQDLEAAESNVSSTEDPAQSSNTAPLGTEPPNVSDLSGMGQSSGPATGVGRLSSSRPRGVSGAIRPGQETNALDARAADIAGAQPAN